MSGPVQIPTPAQVARRFHPAGAARAGVHDGDDLLDPDAEHRDIVIERRYTVICETHLGVLAWAISHDSCDNPHITAGSAPAVRFSQYIAVLTQALTDAAGPPKPQYFLSIGIAHTYRHSILQAFTAAGYNVICGPPQSSLTASIAIRAAVHEQLRLAFSAHRYVYTDGSHRQGTREGSYAWVDTFGDHRLNLFTSHHVLYTEIEAMISAILSTKAWVKHLTIVSDSKVAISVLRQIVASKVIHGGKSSYNPRLIHVISFLRTSPDLTIDFMWVKGHRDDPLNNCADRLALLARRAAASGAAHAWVRERAASIVAEALATTGHSPHE